MSIFEAAVRRTGAFMTSPSLSVCLISVSLSACRSQRVYSLPLNGWNPFTLQTQNVARLAP
jgi:hypothetical protein